MGVKEGLYLLVRMFLVDHSPLSSTPLFLPHLIDLGVSDHGNNLAIVPQGNTLLLL